MRLTAGEFLSAFYQPNAPVHFRVFSDRKAEEPEYKGNKYTETIAGLPNLLPVLKQHNKKNRGIFFVVNSGGDLDDEITGINAQFAENDTLPVQEQMKRLEGFPLPPSIIVKTRKSLHSYWLTRDAKVSRFREIQLRLAKQFDGDTACQNESRVLRIPGFYHCKQEPVLVECLKFEPSLKYTQDELAAHLPEVELPPPIPEARTAFEGIVGSGDRMLEKCAFLQYCRDNAKALPEPFWHCMITNLALASDGQEMVHQLSKPYPGYDKAETEEKIRRAVQINKPHTCTFIQRRLGFQGCPDCGVKAPVVHCILSKDEQVQQLVSEPLDIDTVFADHTLELMAYAKAKLPAEYGKFKLKLKGKVAIRDFEAAVKKSLSVHRDIIEDEAMPLHLDGIDLGGAVQPANWSVTMDKGIRKFVSSGDFSKIVTVSSAPVVISRRFENIDDDNEKLELAFYRNHKWKRLIASRSAVLNKSTLVAFADTGLMVNSATATDLIVYLADYENANLNTIPFVKCISRIGWLGSNDFFPYRTKIPVIFDTEYSEANDIYRHMLPSGDFEVWKQHMRTHRKNPYGRFLLAASFASPLLEKLSHRVFFIHIWHDSKSGKTAAIKAAVSVWGNPAKLMGSFNATAVGLERMAGTLKHLPFGIDELQVLNEKRMSIESIVFSLGSNTGRLRGSKTGGLQETMQWRNIVLTSGEQPMGKDNDTDGIFSRVLEIYAKPTDSQEFARSLHQISIQHYGHAGEWYMKELIRRLDAGETFLKQDYDRMLAELREKHPNSGHLDNAAVVCLGDYYSSLFIFDESETDAWGEAVNLGNTILENNQQLEKADTVSRAWDFVCDWVVANQARFENNATPVYGTKEGEWYYILPSCLREALESSGYDYGKITRGFKDRGYFKTTTEKNGIVRMQTQKRINGVSCKAFALMLSSGNDIEPLV